MLQLFEPLLLGNLVKGEDVDIDALMHLDMLECGFREARAIHADLHEVERRMRLCVWSLQEEFVAHFLLRHFGKSLIVRAHHTYIDIVVPRQNLLPEVRANSRSSSHEVTDSMLLADAIHLSKSGIKRLLKLV